MGGSVGGKEGVANKGGLFFGDEDGVGDVQEVGEGGGNVGGFGGCPEG